MSATLSEPYYAIAAGERAPDFVLPGSGGRRVNFYTEYMARPTVLVFCPGGEEGRAELAGFAELFPKFEALGANVIAVNGETPQDNAGFAKQHRIPFLILSDPQGAVRAGYNAPRYDAADALAADASLGPADRGDAVAFVMDANQRVLEVLGEGGCAERALAVLEGAAPSTRPGAQVPVLVVPPLISNNRPVMSLSEP